MFTAALIAAVLGLNVPDVDGWVEVPASVSYCEEPMAWMYTEMQCTLDVSVAGQEGWFTREFANHVWYYCKHPGAPYRAFLRLSEYSAYVLERKALLTPCRNWASPCTVQWGYGAPLW